MLIFFFTKIVLILINLNKLQTAREISTKIDSKKFVYFNQKRISNRIM